MVASRVLILTQTRFRRVTAQCNDMVLGPKGVTHKNEVSHCGLNTEKTQVKDNTQDQASGANCSILWIHVYSRQKKTTSRKTIVLEKLT